MNKRQLINIATHIGVAVVTAVAVDMSRVYIRQVALNYEVRNTKSGPIGFVPNE